jgi:hypothetical protein
MAGGATRRGHSASLRRDADSATKGREKRPTEADGCGPNQFCGENANGRQPLGKREALLGVSVEDRGGLIACTLTIVEGPEKGGLGLEKLPGAEAEVHRARLYRKHFGGGARPLQAQRDDQGG